LRLQVPPLHRCAEQSIYFAFDQMRDAVNNPPEVVRLVRKVCSRVALELRFEAENAETVKDYRSAYRLRRQADRFEVRYG
jgi:hypothetical protein